MDLKTTPIAELLKQAEAIEASLNRETQDFGPAAEAVAKLDAVIKEADVAIDAIKAKVVDAALNGVDVTVSSTEKRFKTTKGKASYFLPSQVWAWLNLPKISKVLISYVVNGQKVEATIADMEKDPGFFSKEGSMGLKTVDKV